MDYAKKIQDIVNNSIKNNKLKRKKVTNETHFSIAKLELIISKLENIIKNYNEIVNITDEEFSLMKQFSNQNDLELLTAYSIYLKNDLLVFEQVFFDNLKNICIKIINNIILYKEKILQINNELKLINEKEEKLNSLKARLPEYKIVSSDLDLFVQIFREFGLTIVEQINLIAFVTREYMKNIEVELSDYVESNNQSTQINEIDLVELFSKYNYNFYDFNDKCQKRIITEGNLENIRQILNIFKEFNINLGDISGKKSIIKSKSDKLVEIFINSNATLISNLFNAIKDANLLTKLDFDFLTLINNPSIFISRSAPYKVRKCNLGNSEYNIDKYGCNQDFIENLKLLKQKYDDVIADDNFNMIYEKCLSALKKPNMHVLNAIKVYELYGISPVDYLNALSGLKSINQADIFDIAIELDCLDYLKDNMSRVLLKADDDILSSIAIAKRYGYTDDLIFSVKNKNTLLGMKQCKILKLTELKQLLYNCRFEKFDLNSRFSDEDKYIFKQIERIINDSNNSDINISLDELNDQNSNCILKNLEQYVSYKDPFVYVINEMRFSRMKVLRIYNTLRQNNINVNTNILIYILTRNSYLTQEQFDSLYNEINNIVKKEKKK